MRPTKRHRHTYDLVDQARSVARLEWRIEPRRTAGWHLIGPHWSERVDLPVDELAGAQSSDEHQWRLHAEVAAITSTPAALDAAERRLHGRPEHHTGRFRRLTERRHCEIYVTDIDAALLPRTVPELALESVSDVAVLAGELVPGALQVIVRRIALLGGRVVATFCDDGAASGE